MPDYSFLPTALFKLVHNYISDKSFYKTRKCDFFVIPAFSSRQQQQRPRTALATMRVSGPAKDPEFAVTPRVSPERRGRELPSISNTVVISSMDWNKIREAARALTKEEQNQLLSESEGRPSPKSPWAVRRAIALPQKTEVEALEEKEDLKEQGAILERAQRLREEGAEEVRKLNELILSAKCNAVLDSQVAEKERRLAEMAEADRHQEEELEEERRRAESMAAARDNGINKFYKEYRNQLQQQLDEVEAERLRERERKDQEALQRKREEEVAREEDRKARERKVKLKLEMQVGNIEIG